MPETNTCASPQPEYLESDNSWVRVGTIMNVFIQPLFSGNAVVTKDYMCKNVGLIAIQNNCEIRKNMIIIYDQRSMCVQRNISDLNLENLTFKADNNFEIRVSAPGVKDLKIDLLKLIENIKITECMTSFREKFLVNVKCIDCGNEAAQWICRYMNKIYLRLGYTLTEPKSSCCFREYMSKVHESEQDERNIVIPLNVIPRFTLMSHRSLMDLNNASIHYRYIEQFLPDIYILPQSTVPFIEFEWEWIMVGNAILRNVLPWYRKDLLKPTDMPTDMKLKMMLLNCELYQPGNIRVGDAVYLYQATISKLRPYIKKKKHSFEDDD